jgi:CDP-paratose 2-epimerase
VGGFWLRKDYDVSVAVVTGSGGLVGSEAVRFFAEAGLDVIGFDNDTRASLFGQDASTRQAWRELEREVPRYTHIDADIRDEAAIERVFSGLGSEIVLVVHAAAQPSHDWAASDPQKDFSINATATLSLLEAVRKHCPDAVFVFCSTNKVYGDTPNRLPYIETETRWELPETHPLFSGIDESMSIDSSIHSLFGVSKCAADLMVQEYGRYFGMKTACFRCGCITGGAHAGAMQHGFLSYLVKCAVVDQPYTVHGYEGKQVRDNIHARDLVSAFWHFFKSPYPAAVFNMGGGRAVSCSVREAISLTERLTGRPMRHSYQPANRVGDHIWWLSDTGRFRRHCPDWRQTRGIADMIGEIHDRASSQLELSRAS